MAKELRLGLGNKFCMRNQGEPPTPTKSSEASVRNTHLYQLAMAGAAFCHPVLQALTSANGLAGRPVTGPRT